VHSGQHIPFSNLASRFNTMPGVDLNEPINWDELGEFEGNAEDLDYDYVWDSGNEG
jgi:hypothetical protein